MSPSLIWMQEPWASVGEVLRRLCCLESVLFSTCLDGFDVHTSNFCFTDWRATADHGHQRRHIFLFSSVDLVSRLRDWKRTCLAYYDFDALLNQKKHPPSLICYLLYLWEQMPPSSWLNETWCAPSVAVCLSYCVNAWKWLLGGVQEVMWRALTATAELDCGY